VFLETVVSGSCSNVSCDVVQDGTELQVFVAEVKKQIVGVAVIRREEVNFCPV